MESDGSVLPRGVQRGNTAIGQYDRRAMKDWPLSSLRHPVPGWVAGVNTVRPLRAAPTNLADPKVHKAIQP
jgi:hypothetical protein